MKNMMLLFFIVLLSGCASSYQKPNYGQMVHKQTSFTSFIFSYVKWNDEYAVTVKHIPFVKNSVYISEQYDLQFFKLDSSAPIKWTSPKAKEKLVMTGFVKIGQREATVKEGFDMGVNALWVSTDAGYRLVEAKIQQGMSGGPVFNALGEVVGINVGYTNTPITVESKTSIYSIYLPYDTIKEEWERFQSLHSIAQR